MSASGATIIAMRSLASKTTVPIENWRSNGAASRCPSSGKSAPQSLGSRIAIAVEQLREPERGDRDQQPGRLEEPPDDAELDDRPEDERGDEPAGTARR